MIIVFFNWWHLQRFQLDSHSESDNNKRIKHHHQNHQRNIQRGKVLAAHYPVHTLAHALQLKVTAWWNIHWSFFLWSVEMLAVCALTLVTKLQFILCCLHQSFQVSIDQGGISHLSSNSTSYTSNRLYKNNILEMSTVLKCLLSV